MASVLGIAISAAFTIPPGTFVRFAVATAAATSARPTSSSATSSSATPGLRPERSPRLAQPLARQKNPSDSLDLEQTAENDARENYRRLLDCELDCDANSLEQFGALWSASAAARPLRSIVAQSWVTRESAFSWLSSAVTVSRSQPSTARIGWAAGAEMGIRRRDGQQAPRWAARIGLATGASLLQRSKNARRRRDAPRRRPRGTEEHLSQP